MLGLRTLMLILLTAIFAVGGPLRALPVQAGAAPPCHETTTADMGEMARQMADMAQDKVPVHKSKPDALAMNCCVGCLPTGVRDIAPATAPGVVVRLAFASLSRPLAGLSPAPDHGPPRLSA